MAFADQRGKKGRIVLLSGGSAPQLFTLYLERLKKAGLAIDLRESAVLLSPQGEADGGQREIRLDASDVLSGGDLKARFLRRLDPYMTASVPDGLTQASGKGWDYCGSAPSLGGVNGAATQGRSARAKSTVAPSGVQGSPGALSLSSLSQSVIAYPSGARTTLAAWLSVQSKRDGRPVLISFWATWCQPCMEELPIVADVVRATKGRALVVGIIHQRSTESEKAKVEKALRGAKLVSDTGLPQFPQYFDEEGRIAQALTGAKDPIATALPLFATFDRAGELVELVRGSLSDPARYQALLSGFQYLVATEAPGRGTQMKPGGEARPAGPGTRGARIPAGGLGLPGSEVRKARGNPPEIAKPVKVPADGIPPGGDPPTSESTGEPHGAYPVAWPFSRYSPGVRDLIAAQAGLEAISPEQYLGPLAVHYYEAKYEQAEFDDVLRSFGLIVSSVLRAVASTDSPKPMAIELVIDPYCSACQEAHRLLESVRENRPAASASYKLVATGRPEVAQLNALAVLRVMQQRDPTAFSVALGRFLTLSSVREKHDMLLADAAASQGGFLSYDFCEEQRRLLEDSKPFLNGGHENTPQLRLNGEKIGKARAGKRAFEPLASEIQLDYTLRAAQAAVRARALSGGR